MRTEAVGFPATLSPWSGENRLAVLIVLLGAFLAQSVRAQAPGLLWTTNIGARLFAVDAQTNAYANTGGTVIRLNSAGVPYQTNLICPLPGITQRDAAGSFYFTGSFDGTQDFGGITLIGGWTNNTSPFPPHWTRGYPTCFLAKYDDSGALQWVLSFGLQAATNRPTDLLLDLGGDCYVGYVWSSGPIQAGGQIAHFGSFGSNQWDSSVDGSVKDSAITLGGPTASNCCFFGFRYNDSQPGSSGGGRLSASGQYVASDFWNGATPQLGWKTTDSTNAKPVIDDLGQAFQVGFCGSFDSCNGKQFLRKYGFGPATNYIGVTQVWNVEISSEEQWTLARDPQAYIYLAGTNGLFSKYDADGTFIWSTNYGQKCFAMIVDPSGNRFISFANGAVARIGNDPPPQGPGISTPPQSKTIFVGDNVTLSVAATGTPPLGYSWRLNGTNVPNATATSLNINSATEAQSGSYAVAVTNAAGSITSSPALLRVRSVAVYQGSQLLTNGTYVFQTPTTFTVRSAFTNGASFYTLDGSAPDFNSTYYSGPFTLSQSAVIRAIGYSADFFQSQEADTVNALVIINHTLTTSTAGGGSISLNPPGGTYPNTNIVTATSTPSPGWMFLYWLGDAAGTNASVNISMERDKAIYAVFGTTLSTTVAGNGQVQLNPPGGVYPYGSVVRLTGLPQPGSYFGLWGNAVISNTNPLYFAISSPTQTVSSVFGTLASTQAALTVLITGGGRVNVNPRANVYATNQSVTLTATADTGQTFVNWSGDASGTQNPLSVLMAQSKVITANFSAPGLLRLDRPGDGLTPDGFRFSVVSDSGLSFQILGSSNLTTWQVLGTVNNTYGESQFTDSGSLGGSCRLYKAALLP